MKTFNEKLDKHRFVVIPINDHVGYWNADSNDSGWGNWHIKTDDAVFCNKVSIELGGE